MSDVGGGSALTWVLVVVVVRIMVMVMRIIRSLVRNKDIVLLLGMECCWVLFVVPCRIRLMESSSCCI